jgi:hypothetical protein
MSNVAFVKTKESMDSDAVHETLLQLNVDRFKGNLTIERDHDVWLLSYDAMIDGERWTVAQMRLVLHGKKVKKKISMPHARGGDFAFWIDCSVLNELSVRFNGIISDEGISEKWYGVPGKYAKFSDFMVMADPNRFKRAHGQEPIPDEFKEEYFA